LNVLDAIFLSAGVPDPKRGAAYAATADTVAIASAVSALVHVTLGRRLLVWGGQPAITPMIWVVAEGLGVDYKEWVRLYQSRHFQDEFPEDNKRFQNVVYVEPVDQDREKSLRLMRERMFSEFNFTAAVFIGGMGGIIQEYELLKKLQPNAAILPVASTGGAVREIADRVSGLDGDFRDDLDYVTLFHKHLGISFRENRYTNPALQPSVAEERFWSSVSQQTSDS
jgi:hypothetical protein